MRSYIYISYSWSTLLYSHYSISYCANARIHNIWANKASFAVWPSLILVLITNVSRNDSIYSQLYYVYIIYYGYNFFARLWAGASYDSFVSRRIQPPPGGFFASVVLSLSPGAERRHVWWRLRSWLSSKRRAVHQSTPRSE